MTTASLALMAIAVALYLRAGQLYLAQLYLTASPAERAGEPIWRAVEGNAVPRRVQLAWLIGWLPIFCLAWLLARLDHAR